MARLPGSLTITPPGSDGLRTFTALFPDGTLVVMRGTTNFELHPTATALVPITRLLFSAVRGTAVLQWEPQGPPVCKTEEKARQRLAAAVTGGRRTVATMWMPDRTALIVDCAQPVDLQHMQPAVL